ncbi:hypothetical protein [Chroococcidiopsis sp. CCMEE 29]|uniref:hypothetical protein n=1 Tax=Chroococcidiopsis sp. CCMEE 29 TaxID=155894 RepID=UPI00201FE88E|nr:hypothetical protein [Chroococcidiopsis sp. CCMEE 29]
MDQDKRKLQLEQKRLQLQQQRAEQFHKSLNSFLNTMRKSVNTWTFVILWAVIACAGGWVGGINTPLGVTCSARTSLCYQARIRGMKTAIAELPKPQCTKTRKGYMCILPSDIGSKPKR